MTRNSDLAQAGLSEYMNLIGKYAHLSADAERDLVARFHGGCDRSRTQLINAHLKLAAAIAMKYRGYGYPVADLISEANVGLIRAVDKFKPDKGARLATYATLWIRAQIMDKVRSQRSIVRVGDTKDRVYSVDQSLSELLPSGTTRLEMLISPDESPEDIAAMASQHRHQKGILCRLMSRLTEKQRRIVERRLLSDDPPTLDVLGAEFGVSKEATRQQEAKAWATMCRAAGVVSP